MMIDTSSVRPEAVSQNHPLATINQGNSMNIK